jgi:monofunctional biosynthetic peptidoglycan transglycosylase
MIRRVLRLSFKLALWFVALSVLWVAVLRFVPPPFTLTMAGDLMSGHTITKEWTPLSQIDPDMPRAAIAGEDSRFCEHHGFDFKAMAGAAYRNAQGGRIRGGSTISQQTAKNVFLWQGGGFFRKGLEAWFTFWIETVWGKRRIMEVYLNVAETGIGTYGAEAGAQRYFGHSAARLSPDEASRMAAALPSPKKRAVKNPGGWLARHGNRIERRIGIVRRDGLDACVYQ